MTLCARRESPNSRRFISSREELLHAAFVRSPVFATPEQTLRANILHLVIGVTVLIAVSFLPLIVIMQPGTLSRGAPSAAFICGLGLALLMSIDLVERGWPRSCSPVVLLR